MSRKVLDSYSLLAYFGREPGYEKMLEHFEKTTESARHLLLCVINWGEVFYIVYRECGPSKAQEIAGIIETLPIEIVPVDLELTRQAAVFKAKHKMAYADCFAAALAKLKRAELITGDKEFKQIENEVKISWIG